MATSAPSCAIMSAAARPMPADAPVTRATLPCKLCLSLSGIIDSRMGSGHGDVPTAGTNFCYVIGTAAALKEPRPRKEPDSVDHTTFPLWPRAAYVHVPFCAHHCRYCDFALALRHDHQLELYLDAL